MSWDISFKDTNIVVQPPSAPGIPAFSAITQNSATATWAAATSPQGVAGYETSLNGGGTWIDQGNVLTQSLSGLPALTNETLLVRAYDINAVRGAPSSNSFTTLPSGATSLGFPRTYFRPQTPSAQYANSAYQSGLARYNVIELVAFLGIEQSIGQTFDTIYANYKSKAAALGNSSAKALTYVMPEEIQQSRGSTTFQKLWDAVNNNNWWLRTTWPGGSQVVQETVFYILNHGSNTAAAATAGGTLNLAKFLPWYFNQIFILGNAVAIGESNSFAANPHCDGFAYDNQQFAPRSGQAGAWDATNNPTVTYPAQSATAAILRQKGYAQTAAQQALVNPSLIFTGNCDLYAFIGTPVDASVMGLYRYPFAEFFIGQSFSGEEFWSVPQMLAQMQAQEQLASAQSDAAPVFHQINASGTRTWPTNQASWLPIDWQGFRVGLGWALMRGWYFNPIIGSDSLTQVWGDELDRAGTGKYNWMGKITAKQTAAWSNGVWRQQLLDVNNNLVATCLLNPRGNGTQTVSITGHNLPTGPLCDPAVNNGAAVTSVTLNDRDMRIIVP